MFTEILNIVVLLAKPTVVIVIVQRLYCCYCSDHQNDPQLSTKTRFFAILRFFSGFKQILSHNLSDFETIPSDFETISSDIEWFAHHIQRKTKGSTPQPA